MAAIAEVHDEPQLDSFIPLSQYEAQTPGTFFDGKPVLHFYACKTYITLPLVAQQKHRALATLTHLVESAAPQEGNTRIDDIDVWVTDKCLTLYSKTTNGGCRIPYPAITITAVDGAAVLLELNLSDSNTTADDDIEYFQLKIFPTNVEHGTDLEQKTASIANGTNGTTPSNEMLTAGLFKAIADCQELNPDPPGPGEEDGDAGEAAFDETAPGATGWITSENMDQFVDADGNFRMPEGVTFVGGEEEEAQDEEDDNDGTIQNGVQEPLGQGAGRTRTATEAGVEREDESKWRAT